MMTPTAYGRGRPILTSRHEPQLRRGFGWLFGRRSLLRQIFGS